MKLSKTKKIILLGTTLAILTTSIAIPIVLLNKDKENNVEKIFKILKAKTTKEKIIELSNNASGKIIANNQAKIIAKIKSLIGKANLNDVKIEVLMQNDTNISTSPQKIIIKLTKNELSKEIKDFLVKKQSIIDVNKDITAIKKILDSKTGDDLIITLPSSSTGNIIEKETNRNEIIKKIRILIDLSNTNGTANHPSLRGTSIQVSMNVDRVITTYTENIIVSITKAGGKTLTTTKTFQVKRDFTTNEEDIKAIEKILNSLNSNNKLIILPSSSTGSIVNNPNNKNVIERKIRKLIDPSNTSGDPNHPSLRGTIITLKSARGVEGDSISNKVKTIVISISKSDGTSLDYYGFAVKKSAI